MLITRIKLKNWRNFRQVDVPLGLRCYLIGANASGKSNLLDVFRFLRDISKATGGGLQKAVESRGGITRLRCLQARNDSEVRVEVHLSESSDDPVPVWQYAIAFRAEGKGAQRILLTEETIFHHGKHILSRPDQDDEKDTIRRTQTHLEQINNNAAFRDIADFFQATTYLHLVPQLLKFSDQISGRMLEDDPFGQGLLQRIAKTPRKTLDARLRRIQQALTVAVPQFSELRFSKDETSGQPHLEACYQHWRPNGAWQREDQFSDGTLRLIGLLWALQEGNGLLLLEEPELSLNDAIVTNIPFMIDSILRTVRNRQRQVIITTHSEPLLSRPIGSGSILILKQEPDGTNLRPPTQDEQALLEAGLTPAEVLLSQTHVTNVEQLGLFQ